MPHNTKRIYYGPEGRETSIHWKVKVTDAKSPVTINGNLLHALRGQAGVTIGCALSNAAIDSSNVSAFPHPVYLISVTKSTLLAVDKLKKDGSPGHAVRYIHSYGWITDSNDVGTLKRIAKENPSIVTRPFNLRCPPVPPPSGATAGQTPTRNRGTYHKGEAFVPRGALARAVKAGRIGKNVADQLTEVAKK